jgi:hypothetical protein
MNDNTALALVERAKTAIGPIVDAELTALAQRSADIAEITNTAGYEQCRGARIALKNQRIEIERRGKSARDDATKFSKAVITEEKRLVALLEPEEKRLLKLEDAWEAEREAERQRKVRAELDRVTAIQSRIAEFRGCVQMVERFSLKAAQITAHIQDLEAVIIDDGFAEFQAAATAAKDSALAQLRVLLHQATQAEAEEAARLERERMEREAARATAEAEAKRKAEEAQRAAELAAKRRAVELEMAAAAAEEESRRVAAEAQRVAEEARRIEEESRRQEAERQRLAKEREDIERLRAAAEVKPEPAAEPAPDCPPGLEPKLDWDLRQIDSSLLEAKAPDFAVAAPPYDEILTVLAEHYAVTPEQIAEWLTGYFSSQELFS